MRVLRVFSLHQITKITLLIIQMKKIIRDEQPVNKPFIASIVGTFLYGIMNENKSIPMKITELFESCILVLPMSQMQREAHQKASFLVYDK